jgi:DHA1 family tetracycline resistance protein-like MFS transporter
VTQKLTPAVWMILVTALLDMMAMGLVVPVLPHLIEDLTGSIATAGLWTGIMASLWATLQLFCAPLLGGLSDAFGRRRVILVSAAGLGIDWVLMALAPNLWWLVVGRIIGGATSASVTAIFAYMTDITAPGDRTKAFGRVGAAISAGFLVGPALGGLLAEWGPRVPFWTAAALSGVAFLYGLIVLPESLPPERRKAFSWHHASPLGSIALIRSHGDLTGLATGTFLLSFTHKIYTTVFVLYAAHRHGLGSLEVGLLLTGTAALDLVLQGLLVGPITQRFGDRPTMLFGLLTGAVGMVAMGLAPSPAWFVAAMVFNGLMGLAEPTLKSLMSARVPETDQGRMQGAIHSLISLAGIVGPVCFGWLYGVSFVTQPGLVFFVAAAVLVLAALAGAGVKLGLPQTRPS